MTIVTAKGESFTSAEDVKNLWERSEQPGIRYTSISDDKQTATVIFQDAETRERLIMRLQSAAAASRRPKTYKDSRFFALAPLLLIQFLSDVNASRLKIALSQYVVLRNTALFLMPEMVIIRPRFGGKRGLNYHSKLELKTPFELCAKNGNGWSNAVAFEQPMTKGTVAFGFRVGTQRAADVTFGYAIMIGAASTQEPGDSDEFPGFTFCPNRDLFAQTGQQVTYTASGIAAPAKPNSIFIARVDFEAKRVTFFINGVKSKAALPILVKPPLYPAIALYIGDDVVEALDVNDPAFDVLFRKPTVVSITRVPEGDNDEAAIAEAEKTIMERATNNHDGNNSGIRGGRGGRGGRAAASTQPKRRRDD